MDNQFVSASGKLPQAMKVYLTFIVLPILFHYSAAAVVPTVSAEIHYQTNKWEEMQGGLVYVDPENPQIDITCKWKQHEWVNMYEIIWWENQSETIGEVLHRCDDTNGNLASPGTYTMNSTTFRSGRYGCAVRSGRGERNSSGVVYLSTSPTVAIERQGGGPGSAIYFCNVTDDFPANVTREVEFQYVYHNETFAIRDDHDDWQISKDGARLNISDERVQELAAANASLACLVTSPISYRSQGEYYKSQYVQITVIDRSITSPPPTILSPYYVAPALVALALVVPFVLIVIIVKRNSCRQRIGQDERVVDVEQGLQDFCMHRYPYLGQGVSLPQPLQMNGSERTPGVGSSRQPSHDPNAPSPVVAIAVELPGLCDYALSIAPENDQGQHRTQPEGQTSTT